MRTFPILVSFDGKPPLVTGGGELAAVKARLLLKRAPCVDIAADSVVPEIAALVEEGLVSLIAPRPGIDQLRGRPLIIAATEDDEEDARVSAIARALGVPVNVPDRPELCTFALPAIVDRGEVTVAIGTSGASPVLAQRLRAWLEQELHPRLDALAKLAAEFRGAVAERLPSGPPRRKFWEAVFEGAAAEAMLEGDEAKARALIGAAIEAAAEKQIQRGRVLLVGAGPGDPELLTMKAVRALKAADVIFYDRLVGNAQLIERAKAGQTVVRLKGGDPFIFGRGGEELDALRAEGIAIEIVPGVTAGIAAAASLQIPLTHRDVSHTVTFLSGHEAGGEEPSFEHLDLAALAGGKNTLLVYMGVSTAGHIAAKLIAAGFRTDLPVLAVENASRDDERRVLATIAELAAHPERLGLESPAVLIFGEVAGLPAAGVIEDILAAEELKRA
jgi:uroporphyrin-III C-methyltransferase/precorrin-2 dehydrogenase/sirohydrochlorin ferrochelatase